MSNVLQLRRATVAPAISRVPGATGHPPVVSPATVVTAIILPEAGSRLVTTRADTRPRALPVFPNSARHTPIRGPGTNRATSRVARDTASKNMRKPTSPATPTTLRVGHTHLLAEATPKFPIATMTTGNLLLTTVSFPATTPSSSPSMANLLAAAMAAMSKAVIHPREPRSRCSSTTAVAARTSSGTVPTLWVVVRMLSSGCPTQSCRAAI